MKPIWWAWFLGCVVLVGCSTPAPGGVKFSDAGYRLVDLPTDRPVLIVPSNVSAEAVLPPGFDKGKGIKAGPAGAEIGEGSTRPLPLSPWAYTIIGIVAVAAGALLATKLGLPIPGLCVGGAGVVVGLIPAIAPALEATARLVGIAAVVIGSVWAIARILERRKGARAESEWQEEQEAAARKLLQEAVTAEDSGDRDKAIAAYGALQRVLHPDLDAAMKSTSELRKLVPK